MKMNIVNLCIIYFQPVTGKNISKHVNPDVYTE